MAPGHKFVEEMGLRKDELRQEGAHMLNSSLTSRNYAWTKCGVHTGQRHIGFRLFCIPDQQGLVYLNI